jgi:hypothetical protein
MNLYSEIHPIGLYHPLDGITNQKYKLFNVLTTINFFTKGIMHPLLIRIGAAI